MSKKNPTAEITNYDVIIITITARINYLIFRSRYIILAIIRTTS